MWKNYKIFEAIITQTRIVPQYMLYDCMCTAPILKHIPMNSISKQLINIKLIIEKISAFLSRESVPMCVLDHKGLFRPYQGEC